MRKYSFVWLGALGFYAMFLLAPDISRADLVIMGASDPSYKISTRLPDNTTLNIPADVTVSILKTPEQVTYKIEGPFKGKLADYIKIKHCSWFRRLFGFCGREDKSETPTGGVRAIGPKNR